MSKLIAGLSALSVVCVCAASSAQKPNTVEASLKIADAANRSAPPPIAPLSESATLSQKPLAGITVPDGVNDPWFGTCRVGDESIAIVIAKSSADAALPDVIHIDLDADGELAEGEHRPIEVSSQEQRGMTLLRSKPIDVRLALDKGELAAQVSFVRYGDREPMVAIQFPSYLEASVEIDGTEHVVAVVDKDYDGKYGTAGDMWVLAEPGGRPANTYALSAIGERRFSDGKLIGIRVDGKRITVTEDEADGPDPKDAAAHRMRVEHFWAERFDKEREGFVTQRGLDTSRPLAGGPVDWHYVSFEEGLELAEQSGKLLFVDVMAFWCVWCYRMDYYTYPDAEVAKLLEEKFVPVKIIQEQDLAGDYDLVMKDKLEARGIPAMGVFDAEGNLLHKIGGWKKPEDFIAELKTALQKR